ncbi:hypothetical protein QUA00_32390 [Microcoleus sp. T2B6]|uniref:hypothetical protein n=1 Tax=Microcoleus sp. T2B6 TaxID=3055424 RepID=UPI002FD14207
MSRKLNAIIPDETWEALEKIADRELRTKSQMAAILLGEAIAEYWKRNPTSSEPEPTTTRTATKAVAKRGRPSKGEKSS